MPGDRYPNLKNDPDNFLALDSDGTEIGLVGRDRGSRLVLEQDAGASRSGLHGGQSATRGLAARELGACYAAFRAFYQIEE